jgi:hypothetical protein
LCRAETTLRDGLLQPPHPIVCLSGTAPRNFIRFLNDLEKEVPSDQVIHLIMDNYCTHKSAAA